MKETAKRALLAIATIAVLPSLLSFFVRVRLYGADRALLASSQAWSLIPGILGQYLRRAFYRWTLTDFHPSATVEFGTLFSRVGATIGENVYIGPMCHIGLAQIERDVLLAAGVQVPSGGKTHGIGDASRPIREQEGELTTVRIGEGSWIAAGAVVMADVGANTVVASGAVVTKPLPRDSIAGGIPAAVLRKR